MASAAGDTVQTLLVRYKDKIIPVKLDEIAYFYTSEDHVTLTTLDERNYPVEKTLEALAQQLPMEKFYRANRQFIISRDAVRDIAVWFGSRLALNLTVETPSELLFRRLECQISSSGCRRFTSPNGCFIPENGRLTCGLSPNRNLGLYLCSQKR